MTNFWPSIDLNRSHLPLSVVLLVRLLVYGSYSVVGKWASGMQAKSSMNIGSAPALQAK